MIKYYVTLILLVAAGMDAMGYNTMPISNLEWAVYGLGLIWMISR